MSDSIKKFQHLFSRFFSRFQSNLTHLSRSEFVPGLGSAAAKCPYDPMDNSTAIFVESGNPGGYPALVSWARVSSKHVIEVAILRLSHLRRGCKVSAAVNVNLSCMHEQILSYVKLDLTSDCRLFCCFCSSRVTSILVTPEANLSRHWDLARVCFSNLLYSSCCCREQDNLSTFFCAISSA